MSLSLLKGIHQEIAKKWSKFPLYCSTWEAISLQQNEFIAKIARMALSENPVLDGELHLLHVAVIFLNHDAVEAFLRAGANPNQPDQYGWTPLHFAALATDRRMMEHLLKHHANGQLRTVQGWTPQDIFAFVDRAPVKSISLIYEDANGKKEGLTPKKFEELTHARYTNSCKAEADLINTYRISKTSYPFAKDQEGFMSTLHMLPDSPPPFIMKQLKGSIGFGIIANRQILTNTLIGEYTGELKDNHADGKYLLGQIDAQNWRNHAAMLNDGFPNCYLFTLEGPFKRNFLISIDEILPGEELCWNYGPTRLKYVPYTELREKELESFLKNHSIDSLIQNNSTINSLSISDNYLNRIGNAEKLRYLLQTPSALFRLGVKGVLTIEEIKKLHEYACKSPILLDEYQEIDVPNCVKEFNDFVHKWKHSCPLTTEAVRELILRVPELRGIHNTINITKEWLKKIDTQLMKSSSPNKDALTSRQLRTIRI